jgi:hypothetical protein
MYKYTLTPPTDTVSVWLEFSTFDELPLTQQHKTRPTMAWSMARQPGVEVSIQGATRTVSYAHILRTFPDLDPEMTYITTRYELPRSSRGPRL